MRRIPLSIAPATSRRAYSASCGPRKGSNESTARIRPTQPSPTRSSRSRLGTSRLSRRASFRTSGNSVRTATSRSARFDHGALCKRDAISAANPRSSRSRDLSGEKVELVIAEHPGARDHRSQDRREQQSSRSVSPARRAVTLSTLQIVGDAQHLVGRLYSFSIRFVGSLRRKNLHHRIDDRDVRFLEHAEAQFRAVIAARRDLARLARLGVSLRKARRRSRAAARGRRTRPPGCVRSMRAPFANVASNAAVSGDGRGERVGRNSRIRPRRKSCALRSVPSAARAKTGRRACRRGGRARRRA